MLVLASASPRRAELLRQIDVSFKVYPVDIDESVLANESPDSYVLRLSESKARVAYESCGSGPVLGSDTAVVVGNRIFGKPLDYQDFLNMMDALSGAKHSVITAVAVLDAERLETAVSVTEVHFRHLHEAELKNYWQTGEPKGKAGGYAIQGLAAAFISRIEGSYSGVMGLPLYETAEILGSFDSALQSASD